jgi:hypothetical protein
MHTEFGDADYAFAHAQIKKQFGLRWNERDYSLRGKIEFDGAT